MPTKLAAALFAALLTGSVGWAADFDDTGDEPLVTDRPDFTESAETIAPGHLQIESGITRSREDATETDSVGEILLRVGLTPNLELRAGFNSYLYLAKSPTRL